MLFQVDDFDLPEWAHDELKAQCAERAIGVEEFVKYLVCTHVRSLRPHVGAQFTVPPEMEARLVGEGFMVVRRHCRRCGSNSVLSRWRLRTRWLSFRATESSLEWMWMRYE